MRKLQLATVVAAVLCGLGLPQANERAGSGWENHTAPSMSAPRIWIKGEYCADGRDCQHKAIPEDYIAPLLGCSGDECNQPYFQRLLEEARQPPNIVCIRYEGRIYCGEIVRRPR